MTMRPEEDLDTVRAVSTGIARELLLEVAPEEVVHSDVMVEEYLRTRTLPSPPVTDRRHGFGSLESYVLVDLPAAIICAMVVEVVKFYMKERMKQFRGLGTSERLDLLAARFTDEAVKTGLPEDQARELTGRFTDILREKPSILPPIP